MLLWYLGFGLALVAGSVTSSGVVALALIAVVSAATLLYAERWPALKALFGKEG